MNMLKHVVCPFGIIRAIIILAFARLLLHPVQSLIFPETTRVEVFLFVAAFLDIFSRTAGIFTELSEENNKEGSPSLKTKAIKTIRGLFLSNYGGLLLVPVWFGCLVIYILTDLKHLG